MAQLFHQNPNNPSMLKTSSDRSLGFVFSVFFAVVGFWPFPKHGSFHAWALYVAATFLLIALIKPTLLTQLNRFWTALGFALHKIISPLILGVIFWGLFTPLAFFMRMFGKDFLDLNLCGSRDSYWVKRNPPGPAPETMPNQF